MENDTSLESNDEAQGGIRWENIMSVLESNDEAQHRQELTTSQHM